jgi:protease IV
VTAPLRQHPIVLELDLTAEILETVPQDPVGRIVARRRTGVRDLVDGLGRAAEDDHVVGLVAKVGPSSTGFARVQEVREAVRDFAASGRPTVAWADSFGEFGPGTVPYYLATGFDEIWLQPSGDVGLTGVVVEARFLRGTLDKLGVRPQFGQRHEYKNAANTIQETALTDAHREALNGIATSVADQLVEGIAEARRLSVDQVRELLDRAPLSAADASEAGLVDHVGYRDEAYAALRARVPADTRLRYLARYRVGAAEKLARAMRVPRKRGRVALVHAVGPVRSGRSGRGPLPGQAIGSDTVTAALRAAGRDEHVRAVVLRVDSPGGSYVASDAIWREVAQLRRHGTPVVASMGDVAASGGYFVAMGADAIVAQPGTITGSIGVVAGKAVVDGLLGRAGIGFDDVAVGERARMFSSTHGFDDADWAKLDSWLDRVYEDFVGKAAAGRGMTRDAVHEVARGRVWTGADARERGLVDELGGLARAVELARRRGDLPDDAPVVPFPHVSPLERLRPPESSEDAAAASVVLDAWGPVAWLAGRLGLSAGGPLLLPYDLRIR